MGLKEAGLRGSLRNVSVGVGAIPDSVVSLYEYEDDSDTTTAIDSQGSNDATVNGATYSTDAAVGSLALSHDGTDSTTESQSAVDHYSNGNEDAVAIAAHCKPLSETDNAVAFGWGPDTDNFVAVREVDANGDGTVTWELFFQVGGVVSRVDSGVAVDTTAYQHIYAEVTSSNFRIVIDETEAASTSHSRNPGSIGSGTQWTGALTASTLYDDVLVDDFAVAEASLTDNEISSLATR